MQSRCPARFIHEPLATTACRAVLPGVLGSPFDRQAQDELTWQRTGTYVSDPSPRGCLVTRPSPRSRQDVSCITRARDAPGRACRFSGVKGVPSEGAA
jgi:hypothetical protein